MKLKRLDREYQEVIQAEIKTIKDPSKYQGLKSLLASESHSENEEPNEKDCQEFGTENVEEEEKQGE